jgi:hypothetical protein
MGFVSAIVINNDLISDIKDDKDFGSKVYDACLRVSARDTNGIPIVCGPGIAASAVLCHHASVGIPVIVGGGMHFHVVRDAYIQETSNNNIELATLKALADKLGFNISKKYTRKKKK